MKIAPNGGLGALKNASPWNALSLRPRGFVGMNIQAFLTGRSAASFARSSSVAFRTGVRSSRT